MAESAKQTWFSGRRLRCIAFGTGRMNGTVRGRTSSGGFQCMKETTKTWARRATAIFWREYFGASSLTATGAGSKARWSEMERSEVGLVKSECRVRQRPKEQ